MLHLPLVYRDRVEAKCVSFCLFNPVPVLDLPSCSCEGYEAREAVYSIFFLPLGSSGGYLHDQALTRCTRSYTAPNKVAKLDYLGHGNVDVRWVAAAAEQQCVCGNDGKVLSQQKPSSGGVEALEARALLTTSATHSSGCSILFPVNTLG